MSEFADQAARLFRAAENGAGDMTILIGEQGGIHMISESDWSLESLLTEHGARIAYRVHRETDRLRVEGKSAGRSCVFEAEAENRLAQKLLADEPRYEVVAATEPRAALLPARIWQIPPEEWD